MTSPKFKEGAVCRFKGDSLTWKIVKVHLDERVSMTGPGVCRLMQTQPLHVMERDWEVVVV